MAKKHIKNSLATLCQAAATQGFLHLLRAEAVDLPVLKDCWDPAALVQPVKRQLCHGDGGDRSSSYGHQITGKTTTNNQGILFSDTPKSKWPIRRQRITRCFFPLFKHIHLSHPFTNIVPTVALRVFGNSLQAYCAAWPQVRMTLSRIISGLEWYQLLQRSMVKGIKKNIDL